MGSGAGSGSAGSGSIEEPSPHDRELTTLWELEKRRRRELDFATHPASNAALGPDPYRIVRAGPYVVGVLRGASAVVLLDGEGKELARAEAPGSPTAVVALPDGDVLVAGEGERSIVHYAVGPARDLTSVPAHRDAVLRGPAKPDLTSVPAHRDAVLPAKPDLTIARLGSIPIDALDIRGLAVSPDGKRLYVVEERQGRLLSLPIARQGRALRPATPTELGRCHGPIGVAAIADLIVTNCLLDRTLEIRRGRTVQRIQHDGPLWGFALHSEPDGSVLLAAGGVEDHPLERADGGFGYIDSYLFLYRLSAAAPARLAAINLSEHRAITPKAISISSDQAGLTVTTAGYGGGRLVTLRWPERAFDRPPEISTRTAPPGTAAAVITDDGTWIAANPLLDAWVAVGSGGVEVHPMDAPTSRTLASRIGELLFFTEMMAPWSGTEGKRSRFTCETCHHEGYTDGRTHFTGRKSHDLEVHASTRPLVGLFNNAPYFSRALDASMTQMVHSEFKVANRHNGRDPWFSLSRTDLDWWPHVAGLPERLTAEQLREAFMAFLIDFSHRTNPAASHRTFTALERSGATTFRDRCASCHAPRLIAEEPSSELPFERWEPLVLSSAGPIVWNNAAYQKTGILPYVHDDGARVPTLRRLYKKWPYFTNGSAKSLAAVLDRFTYDATSALHHDDGTTRTKLTTAEKSALLAFLELL